MLTLQEAARDQRLPVRLLRPSKADSMTSVSTATTPRTTAGSTGSGPRGAGPATTTESSLASSQWSQRKRDMYGAMTTDEQQLFDELQDEIEELRKLLSLRDQSVVDKVPSNST